MNNSLNTSFNTTQQFQNVSQFLLLKFIIVIVARAGFILIQAGSIPTEQFYDLLLHNIVEFSISSTSYGMLGSIFSFGEHTLNGVIGYGNYSALPLDYVVFGYSIIIFGSAIITTCLASRLHFLAYIIIAFVYSGITQPLLLHWIYSPHGWLKQGNIFNTTVEIHDYGGALTLNVTSGLICVLGLAFLGRRLMRLYHIDEYSLGAEAPVVIPLGYALVIAGYIANSTLVNPTDAKGKCLVLNVMLVLSAGSLASVIIELFVRKVTFNFWLITRLLQGSLVGLTFTASIIDFIHPPVAFGTAIIGSCIICYNSKVLYKLVLQDYCNVQPIFFLTGIWSPLIQVIIMAIDGPVKTSKQIFLNFVWHGSALVILSAFLVLTYGLIFALLWCCGFLRNEIERSCHARSLNMMRYTRQCPLHHLIESTPDDDVLEPGLSGKTTNELIHSQQLRSNLRHFRVRYSSGKLNKPTFSQATASSTNQKDIPGSSKHIYTLQNLIRPVGSSHPLSSGDRMSLSKIIKGDKSMEHQQKTDLNKKSKKRKSHKELVKSPRVTNFRRRKKLKTALKNSSMKLFKEEIGNESVNDDFDAKYNDGFVTIKLPNSEANVSSD